ncbi:restriction endonuclease [uncultured Agrobacterium sp.]|uniref:nSTAND3 domain-containing NTPase n=1 Tax=uncultured Agrobacterium sp. TaxID=157277 RepID=UPI0025E4A0E8|nr:restriction endonuclease [uncultured Agrobacterium sp.]
MSYDFHQLSPHDFETLVRDLLQAEWGLLLESFKTGRDGGIDLRYARGAQNIIGQAKHYVRTGLPGLLRDLRTEAEKLARLQPNRYLLATSAPLSPADKDRIVAIFGGAVRVSDVLGQEDLNNLLARNQAVEHKHYKLWLASRAVLDRVLNSDVLMQTEFQVEKVYATIRRNVRSDAYPRALEILEQNRVAIISGAPGVGKTTLANMLLYAHLERGWEPVIIRRDIAEGQRLFQRGKSQIFYFDDFMGATFLGDRAPSLAGNEDRAISDFIEQVRASPNARMIVTTREHIFGQALAASERLRHAGLESHKILLRIGDYSLGQKARILYNHLYFSDLPDEYKDVLLQSEFYLEIVQHPKFNPRLIEWLSSFHRVRMVRPDNYQGFVRNLLKDPSDVWLHAYEQQLSDAGRSLLLVVYSLGGKAEGTLLEPAFKKLHETRAARWGFSRRPGDWSTAMSELANAFIRPAGRTAFEVLDPSVIDLANAILRRAPETAVDLIIGAVDFSQIQRIWEIADRQLPAIKQAVADASALVSEAVRARVENPRRIVNFSSGSGFLPWTAEARVSSVIPLADGSRVEPLLAVVESLEVKLTAEWDNRHVRINDGVELLRAMETVKWPKLRNEGLTAQLTKGLIESAEAGCRLDELREIVSVVDLEGPENAAVLSTLQTVFEVCRGSIDSEIGDCSKDDDFKGLEEDLELFETALGVDVSQEKEMLEEALSKHVDYEEQRADQMMDDYKERLRESRVSDDSVRNMFDSLRGDRNA